MENQPKTYTEMENERRKQEKLKDCFLENIRRTQLTILGDIVFSNEVKTPNLVDAFIDGVRRLDYIFDVANKTPSFCFVEPDAEFLELEKQLQDVLKKEKTRLGVK